MSRSPPTLNDEEPVTARKEAPQDLRPYMTYLNGLLRRSENLRGRSAHVPSALGSDWEAWRRAAVDLAGRLGDEERAVELEALQRQWLTQGL